MSSIKTMMEATKVLGLLLSTMHKFSKLDQSYDQYRGQKLVIIGVNSLTILVRRSNLKRN